MAQTRLPVIRVDSRKREALHSKLKELYHDFKGRFKNFGTFQSVLGQGSSYGSKDLKDEQQPEEFAKQFLIKPLIEFLGYETVSETVLPSPGGRKKPDYTIRPVDQDKPIFYVEAEPFNTDLTSSGHGISQVNDWLLSRASKTSYGIATDGLQWILVKFEEASSKGRQFFKVDLRPVFLKILNPHSFGPPNEVEQIEESLLSLDSEYALVFLENYLEKIEEEKEEISKNFYNDYVRYVFGFDEKGERVKGTYLLKEVISPATAENSQSNLFAVIFMNRVIFIKFLEEKGIVSKNLLKGLLEKYRESGSASTFYEAYLKALFYEVFNKGKESRSSIVRTNHLYRDIPYLNGGLFRQVIPLESSYKITNEGIDLVIDSFFKKYTFGSNAQINPDMLGYIFEKTINFISGTGTNQQKAQGAYYTPDDVVGFIIDETLTPIIFRKMLEGLKNAGWKDIDLKNFNSIETLLNSENRPKNRIAVRKMIEAIDSIRVLDPACGSGHFLTAMLSRILRVKESLMRSVEEEVDRYHLKRQVISKNLFGVDIDANAVEIARLRLWLALIEEVEDTSHIKTLPNIDFNVVSGNSLVGWLNENLEKYPLIDLSEEPSVKETLEGLGTIHQKEISDVKKLLERMRIEDTIKAYEKLVEIYSLESGEAAVKVREGIEKTRQKLYEVFNNSYIDFLHERSNLDKTNLDELSKQLEKRTPFHWKVDFGDIFATGGFDVVVGNPPYIENGNYSPFDLMLIKCSKQANHRRKENNEGPLLYNSRDCGNTHAYFIERSIKLLESDGRFGFIVPLSLVSTERMDSIREFIHNNSSEAKYYNFDDRPSKIFSGIEDCRSTIVVTQKGTGVKSLTTSKYHRWYSKDRAKFLKAIKTTGWTILKAKAIIPKIGTPIEKDILKKITEKTNGKTLQNYAAKDEEKIWYHNAPRYWIHAHPEEYLPKIEYYSGYKKDNMNEITPQELKETKVSSHYKAIAVNSKHAYIVNGLLNSSLFYWWFVVWSDGRDLLAQHITSFPLNLDVFPPDLEKQIQKLVEELMESYENNSNVKLNLRSGGKYCIRIKEIIPKKSKAIIDQIDDIFADYFDFTSKEKEFIKTFDLKFRTE